MKTQLKFLKLIELNEKNIFYTNQLGYGEPQLGKRNLYKDLSAFNAFNSDLDMITNNIFWILSLADGKTSSLEIFDKCKSDANNFNKAISILIKKGLFEEK